MCTWLYVVVVMTCVYGTKISRVEKKHVASHYLLHCMCVRSGIYNDVYMALSFVMMIKHDDRVQLPLLRRRRIKRKRYLENVAYVPEYRFVVHLRSSFRIRGRLIHSGSEHS